MVIQLQQTISELPLTATVFLVLWLLVMILVPVLKWVWGDGAERLGISLGVIFQAATIVVLLAVSLPAAVVVAVCIAVPGLGWFSEFIGCRTGIPFGRYHYTDVLQPQLLRVPAVIPLAWLMMMPPAWGVAALLVGFPSGEGAAYLASLVGFSAVSGAAFTAWDFFLDPQMVHWNFWQWDQRGAYFGIPLVNFAGWFLVSTLISGILFALLPIAGLPLMALLMMYAITWLLETIAQTFFWNLRGSAGVGFLIMGAFSVAAFLAG